MPNKTNLLEKWSSHYFQVTYKLPHLLIMKKFYEGFFQFSHIFDKIENLIKNQPNHFIIYPKNIDEFYSTFKKPLLVKQAKASTVLLTCLNLMDKNKHLYNCF
jgi:hypothetical protein